MLAKTNEVALRKSLARIEKELDTCRTSVMDDGWQTMRYAKKARKWDVLAQHKMRIKAEIENCEDEDADVMCGGCNCWKQSRAVCS